MARFRIASLWSGLMDRPTALETLKMDVSIAADHFAGLKGLLPLAASRAR